MRKKHRRENRVLKLLIWIGAAAAGVTAIALFVLLTSREPQQEHKNADKRQQAEPLVIEVPEQATEGSIRVFDYDGYCIYAYYGKIEIRNDGRDGMLFPLTLHIRAAGTQATAVKLAVFIMDAAVR